MFKTDCRHYHSDRPCQPHKLRGKTCATCDEYDFSAARVLVIKLAAMGDVLRATSILSGVKARFAAPIVWLTRPEAVPLLEHNPYLDEVWPMADALWPRLENEVFKAVIGLDAERTSAGLCALARSKTKLGYSLDGVGDVMPLNEAAYEWLMMGLSDHLKRRNQKTYQQIAAAIAGVRTSQNDIVFELTETERFHASQLGKSLRPDGCDAVIGFNTGGASRWKRKQWTLEGFIKLGQFILRDTSHAIFVYGGAAEEEFNAQLERALGNPRVVCVNTKNSVREFAMMLSLCDVLVTGDTLGLHLAAALRKPLVAIFGPTSAAEIELYGRGRKIVPPAECRSYYSRECHASPCCMETISADAVFSAVRQLLAAQRPPSRPSSPLLHVVPKQPAHKQRKTAQHA